MVKYTDVMFDIETMDITPTAVILSIGAVRFNPRTGAIDDTGFYSIPRIQPQIRAGRTISADTLKWLFEQEKDVQIPITSDESLKPVLAESLKMLKDFVNETNGDSTKVWGNGSVFDVTILENAYLASSKGNHNSIPWKFWNIRDLRTLYDLTGKYEGVRNGTFHNALDDAAYQAKGACWAYQQL